MARRTNKHQRWCGALRLLAVFVCGAAGAHPGLRFTLEPPRSVVLPPRGALTLNCAARDGNGAATSPELSWRKDGRALGDGAQGGGDEGVAWAAPNGTLHVARAGREHEGDYACVARGARGAVVVGAATRVRVAGLSEVEVEAVSEEVRVGEVARLECRVSGRPEPLIAWERDGTALPADSPRHTLLPSGVLQISAIRSEDAGRYRCQATNMAATRYSREVEVSVLPPALPLEGYEKPNITQRPRNVTVEAGGTAVLECVAQGRPRPIVSWSRLDQQPLDVYHSQVLGSGNLLLADVQPHHAGVYVCRASVPGTRNFTTATGQLTVLAAPWFVEQPESVSRPRAGTARFMCHAEGVPPPAVAWLKNGEPIHSNGRVKVLDNRLVITQLIAEDEAYYQCVAENALGSGTAAAWLGVVVSEERPGAPRAVAAHTVSSTAILLTWERPLHNAHRVIAYSVHYMKAEGMNNEEYQIVIGNDTSRYLVDDLDPATNYTFYLVAYMPVGASRMSEHVMGTTLEDVPLRAPELSLSSLSPREVRVSWGAIPPRYRRGRLTAYRLWYRRGPDGAPHALDVPGERADWLLRGLAPDSTYLLRVAAATRAGWGEPSVWLSHRTPKLTARDVPVSPALHLEALNCTAVRVTWKAASGRGAVRGHRLLYREQEGHLQVGPILLPARDQAYVISDLEPRKKYQVRLSAYSDEGEGYEADQTISTADCAAVRGKSAPPPPPPHRLHARTNGSRAVALHWLAPVFSHGGGSLNYTLRCNPVGLKNASLVRYVHTTEERLLVEGLQPDTRYEFAVRLHLGSLLSPWSPVVYHSTPPERPSGRPGEVRVAAVSPRSALVAWQPPDESNGTVTRYTVLYGTPQEWAAGAWRSLHTHGSERVARVDGLQAGEVYVFRVEAVTASGPGPGSPPVRVHIPRAQPGGAARKPGGARTSHAHGGGSAPAEGAEESAGGAVPGDGSATAITIGVCIALACIVLCLIVLLARTKARGSYHKAERALFPGQQQQQQGAGSGGSPGTAAHLASSSAAHGGRLHPKGDARLVVDGLGSRAAWRGAGRGLFGLGRSSAKTNDFPMCQRPLFCTEAEAREGVSSLDPERSRDSALACAESSSTSGCSSSHEPSPMDGARAPAPGYSGRFSQASLEDVVLHLCSEASHDSAGVSDDEDDAGRSLGGASLRSLAATGGAGRLPQRSPRLLSRGRPAVSASLPEISSGGASTTPKWMGSCSVGPAAHI
ncbi:protogenin isoform X1 [Petromyzon marinus]|uniref:Protogenin-like isoform X1 n=1 Tax=Petromyzon marinus TaxID=7757 RepID=A0AAJ7T1P8_PETMA|nr:protogenin-like isoform X1 [Petromyzon marinus]